MVQDRQANLTDLVQALSPPGRFTRGINCRQQQCDQDADNGNHN
jgi:hypothetical protein